MTRRLVNYFSFQIGWLACALGAARGVPLVGPLITIILLGLHLALTPNRGREIRLVVAVGVFGTVVDSLEAMTGFISYNGGYPRLNWLCPLWITAMWVLFASTLNSSLRWLRDRYLLAALLGAVFGPLSYFAGDRMGAIELNVVPINSAIVMVIIWGIITPFLVWLAKRMGQIHL
jgi:hypothetical protein